ncbi:hypothetical protein VPFG_00136 [Vibrio phage nt-1]|uniref:Uncharacterized protein n=1 Tax=Vibrio phage nt-1 TaxID=115992 RepID=R9TGB9_9CAUD|nr:hypothetical protein VPFG_00136 [Vibrio phage nt-1]AGN30138.1 hypothetical protein VPFG_00136 [Vibrio phage nt-1]
MITFKRRNLMEDHPDCTPIWAYDSVDRLASTDVMIRINERNFYNNVTGESHSKLRITRDRSGNKWVLRATSAHNACKLVVVCEDFKTKKEVVEYVNEVYFNTKGL